MAHAPRSLTSWKTGAPEFSISVFECDLDQARYLLMVERLRRLICAKDSIRVYRICQACAGEVTLLGRGRPVTRDRAFYDV